MTSDPASGDIGRRGLRGHQTRSLRVIVLVALCAVAGTSQALGLGDLATRSALGEPLRVDVALRVAAGEALDASCFRLVPPRSTGGDVPWLTRGRLALEGGSSSTRLTITGLEPANDPILMISLQVGCGFGVAREYAVLLSPPTAIRTVVPPTAARPARVPDRSAAWEIIEGETLGSIAEALYPESRPLQRRFVAAAQRANPDLVAGAADPARAELPPGATLVLPARRDLAVEPPRRAAGRGVPMQPASGTAKPVRVARAPAGKATAEPPDRLRISGSADVELPLRLATLLNEARTARVTETQRELLRHERRLLEALQEKIVEELALADKIRRMEERLADLHASLARLDQQIQAAHAALSQQARDARPAAAVAPAAPTALATTAPVAPTSPAPAAEPRPAKRTNLLDWALTVGAAVIVGVLLGALVYLRRRRSDVEPESALGDLEGIAEPDAPLTPPDDEYQSTMKISRPVLEAAAAGEKRPDEYETVGQVLTLEDHDIDVAEHESAIELAEIMLSFGRVKGAAQTLADYVESNPKQAVQPWLKLLDVYRSAGMKAEWEALARRLHTAFNVEVLAWDGSAHSPAPESLEGYPHLMNELQAVWGTPSALEYLNQLLKDNRSGMRSGFPLGVLNEILTLISLLELQKPLPERAEASRAPTQRAFG